MIQTGYGRTKPGQDQMISFQMAVKDHKKRGSVAVIGEGPQQVMDVFFRAYGYGRSGLFHGDGQIGGLPVRAGGFV